MARIKSSLPFVVLFILVTILFVSGGAQAQTSGWGACTGGLCYTGGNVGVNTLSPLAKIDINGGIKSKVATDGGSTFVISPNNGTSASFGMSASNAGGFYLGRTTGPGAGVNTDFFIGPSGGTMSKVPGDGAATHVIAPADGVSQKYGMTVINGTGGASGFYLGRTTGVGAGVNSDIRIYPSGGVCIGSGC